MGKKSRVSRKYGAKVKVRATNEDELYITLKLLCINTLSEQFDHIIIVQVSS